MDYKTGYYAVSKAGHDKGKLFLIWKHDSQYVYLVDGIYKKKENPKKKKKCHVQIKCCMDQEIENKINNSFEITNDDIQKAINRHLK